MAPKECLTRAREQDALWASLDDKAALIEKGSMELEGLACWLKGTGHERELGILVQQIVGSLFCGSYTATSESWDAALALDAAPRSRNPLKLLWWSLTGKVRKAKGLLASKVNGDLAGVHATGIALHNIVKSLQHMRTLYCDIGRRPTLSPEEVSQQCLFAPASVLRQATDAGTVAGCPFSRLSLFIVALGEAQRKYGSEDVVFLKDSWSRCPAERWVPALLEGVWRRAIGSS
jgi:hypothetical protein